MDHVVYSSKCIIFTTSNLSQGVQVNCYSILSLSTESYNSSIRHVMPHIGTGYIMCMSFITNQFNYVVIFQTHFYSENVHVSQIGKQFKI